MDKKSRRGLHLQVSLPGIGLRSKKKFKSGALFLLIMTTALNIPGLSINLFALRVELRLTNPPILINHYPFVYLDNSRFGRLDNRKSD